MNDPTYRQALAADPQIIGQELKREHVWCQRGARLLVQERVSIRGPTEIIVLEWSLDGRFIRVRYPNSVTETQPAYETWVDIQKEQWVVAGVVAQQTPEEREKWQQLADRLGVQRP